MPIKHRLERELPADADRLRSELADEWRNPKAHGQPLIVIEGGKGQPRRVYVIWDQWGDLNQAERSEVIMDVICSLDATSGIEDPTLVTVAMGLTEREAQRMGIKPG